MSFSLLRAHVCLRLLHTDSEWDWLRTELYITEFLRLGQEVSRLLSLHLLNRLWLANALLLVPDLSEMRTNQEWKDRLGLHWHSVLQILFVTGSETGPIRQTILGRYTDGKKVVFQWLRLLSSVIARLGPEENSNDQCWKQNLMPAPSKCLSSDLKSWTPHGRRRRSATMVGLWQPTSSMPCFSLLDFPPVCRGLWDKVTGANNDPLPGHSLQNVIIFRGFQKPKLI